MFMAQELVRVEDHYKVLGVEYDATEDSIRTSYLRLALKWHPDKHNGASEATLKFQEINEAYRVLSDPLMRHEYDMQGNYILQDYNITDYLKRFKSLILTCSGLGISSASNRQYKRPITLFIPFHNAFVHEFEVITFGVLMPDDKGIDMSRQEEWAFMWFGKNSGNTVAVGFPPIQGAKRN